MALLPVDEAVPRTGAVMGLVIGAVLLTVAETVLSRIGLNGSNFASLPGKKRPATALPPSVAPAATAAATVKQSIAFRFDIILPSPFAVV